MKIFMEYLDQIGEDVLYEIFDDTTKGYIENQLSLFKEIYPGDYDIDFTYNDNNTLSYALRFHNKEHKTWYLMRWSE